MKSPILNFAAALLATGAFVAPAHAQDGMEDQVEQGKVGDVIKGAAKEVGCGIVGEVPVLGGLFKKIIKCDRTSTPDPQPIGGGTASPIIPDGEIKPSLTVNVLKLTGQGAELSGEAAGPSTVFERGSGFAMVMQNTAPGYLEVWSVSDTASYIEGAVLPEAGALVLPATVQGLYRFNDNSPEDYLQFKFYPCEPSTEQGFELEENQGAAELTGNAAAALARLSDRLPSCPFSNAEIDAAISAKKPQDDLFRTALPKEVTYDVPASAYVVDTNRTRPFTTFIKLNRR